MAGIGRIRNSSSIQTTLIRNLFLKSSAGSPADFTQLPCGSSLSLAVLVTPVMLEVIIVQTVRGSMVCNRSDKEFRKLRIARAYIKLLRLPQGDERFVSLVRIGSYEVRMLDASQTGSAAKPLFCLELFDHDGKTAVDNCVCYDIEEGAATFEEFISR